LARAIDHYEFPKPMALGDNTLAWDLEKEVEPWLKSRPRRTRNAALQNRRGPPRSWGSRETWAFRMLGGPPLSKQGTALNCHPRRLTFRQIAIRAQMRKSNFRPRPGPGLTPRSRSPAHVFGLCLQYHRPGAFSPSELTFSTAARHSAGAGPFVSHMTNLTN
jgi:hypothetical protein